jgi:hypothetical protein
MAKFLYLYSGGEMAETPEAQEEATKEWTAWFSSLGDSVADIGNPFGAGTTVKNGGASGGGASKLGGYSIINAERTPRDVPCCNPVAALRCTKRSSCKSPRLTSHSASLASSPHQMYLMRRLSE